MRNKTKNTHAQTLICCALVIGLSACGGGSSSSPDPEPQVEDESGDDPALAHCAGSGGGFFKNTSTAVGLCYSAPKEALETDTQQMGGGLAFADIDNDGMPELYVSHGRNSSGKLFTYNGSSFVELTGNNGISTSGLDQAGYFIDLDVDGWKDFISIQYEGIEVYMNDGTGHFVEATNSTNIVHDRATYSMAAADYDLDGDIDLFFSHWGGGWDESRALSQYLWQNDGSGAFTDVSMIVPIRPTVGPSPANFESEYSFTPTFADINSDGYPDILLAGDFLSSQVLLNDAGTRFIDITTSVISDENGMGASVADYDGDGDLDWFVSSIYFENHPTGNSGNRLYRNDGHGVFEDVTDEAGVRQGFWGWGSCFADFDNDGNVDLFHTNGMRQPDGPQFDADPSRLFMSNGDGTFTEESGALGISHTDHGRGVLCADYNRDGKIDVFIANNGTSPTVYTNDNQNSNHYLQIDLVGSAGNPSAIGARVTVITASGSQMQELHVGSWYLSQGPRTLHFGLGQDEMVLSVNVDWPGSNGASQNIQNISADQQLVISQP